MEHILLEDNNHWINSKNYDENEILEDIKIVSFHMFVLE